MLRGRLRLYSIVGIFGTLAAVLVLVQGVQAIDLQKNIMAQVNAGATSGGLGTSIPPQIIIATLLQALLGLFATVFMVLILMSGYWLLTARGQEERETKAIDTIRRAITGLIVVLMAFAIVTFVNIRIQRATTTDPTPNTLRN